MLLFWITGSIFHVTGSLLHENSQKNSTFHMTRGSITDHVLKHATRYSVMVTETRNALNALKQGLLGQGFADHDNLLAKLEKASS